MGQEIYSKLGSIPTGYAPDRIVEGCLVLEGGAFRGMYTQVDKAEQSKKKQDAGNYHIVPPNISPGANRAASHNKSRIVYDTKFPCGIQRPARKHFEPHYIR